MKKGKRHLPICLFGMLMLLLTVGNPVSVRAEKAADIVASGSCGDAIEWTLSSAGTMILSGTGGVWDNWSEDVLDYAECKEVVIQEGITEIGHGAFLNCTKLEKVSLPSSLLTIDSYAFKGCSSLTNIEIPQNVNWLIESAFDNCTNLESINVHADNALFSSIDGVLYMNCDDGLRLYRCPEGFSGTFYVPANTVDISGAATYSCNKITDVVYHADTLDEGLWTLGFKGCENLCSFSVLGQSRYWGIKYEIVDGALYKVWPDSAEGRAELMKYPSGRGECNIWEECTWIQNGALSGNTKITTLILPDRVTGFGSDAFMNCTSLKSVYLPPSITYFGQSAFRGCKSIESIVIPDGVTKINDSAFSYCSALKTVTFGSNVTEIGWGAFNECNSLTDIYYGGTEKQWEKISIDYTYNWCLYPGDADAATIHYMGANVQSVSLKEAESLCVGGKKTLTVNFSPENASYKAISWETSDANIATVENGVVTAVAPGTVTITATSLDTGCTATCLVEISECVYGDANGDDIINTKDVIILRRYLASKNPVTGESSVEVHLGGDVNGDNVVNTKDIIMLRRYLAAKNPITGESSVVLGPTA